MAEIRIPIATVPHVAARGAANARTHLTALPPLSLYVHFPWCVRKCPYCDFNSHEFVGASDREGVPREREYLNALRRDLELALPSIWGRRIHTVFIGGGTPSLLSAEGLDRLLADIRALVPLDADAEITLEANPGTFEIDRFRSYRASGVNRLSIGIQSFDNLKLKALGRIHGRDEALRAAEIAAACFDNFNLDLMYGLPGQSLADCATDIETALSVAGPHLSFYQLTLEPNTTFAKYPPQLPSEDDIATMQEMIEEATAAHGFRQYEISAYAKPGLECRHNLNYWRFGDYVGIGAGAHGKVSFADRIERQVRFRNPDSYLDACGKDAPIAQSHEVHANELPFEFMLNALRLVEGVSTASFTERTGVAQNTMRRALEGAERKGLLDPDPTVFRATPLGRRFLNDLQSLFL